MKRISANEYFLQIAKAVAQRSTCIKRRYGCVIVKDGEIISTGYNGSPKGDVNCSDLEECDRLNIQHNSGDYSTCKGLHAEQNAIIFPSYHQLQGSYLYLYSEDVILGKEIKFEEVKNPLPCPLCYKIIKNAGIVKIINNEREVVVNNE